MSWILYVLLVLAVAGDILLAVVLAKVMHKNDEPQQKIDTADDFVRAVTPVLQSETDLLAEQGISATVLDMYCVKPLDAEAVIEAAGATRVVVTVEEHSPFGGLGSMVAQVVGEHCPRPVKCLSLPDAPVITGTSPEVFAHYGLTGEGIAKTVAEFLPAE